MKAYRLVLVSAAALSLAACSMTSTASSGAPQLMFVHSAEDLKVDPAAGTFRLVKVSQQTLYFSDRPQRIGHWDKGSDNFGENPPNASLSIFGDKDIRTAIVELTSPKLRAIRSPTESKS